MCNVVDFSACGNRPTKHCIACPVCPLAFAVDLPSTVSVRVFVSCPNPVRIFHGNESQKADDVR